MSNDTRDHEVRAFLHRFAYEVEPPVQAPSHVLRRARRRIGLTVFGCTSAALLVAFGAFSGLRMIERERAEHPAGGGQDNQIIATIPVGLHPSGLAIGEGAAWVANGGDGTVSRVDPSTDQVVATIDVGGRDGDIEIATGGGAVWVTNGARDVVQRIDPVSNRIVATIPLPGPIHPTFGIGSVWVSDYDSGSVSRIDATSNKVVATIPVTGSDPHGIAVLGSDVWVAIDDTGEVLRIDPVTNGAVSSFTTASYGDLVAGFGSVWGPGPGGSILRIDPATGSSVMIDVGGEDHYQPEVSVGDDAVWVIAGGSSGSRLVRVDPATDTVDGSLRLDGAYLVEAGFGSIWVIDGSTNSLERINPNSITAVTPASASANPSVTVAPTPQSSPSPPNEGLVPHSESTTIAPGASFDFDSGETTGGPGADVSLGSGSLSPVGAAWVASVTDEVGTFGDKIGTYGDLGPADLRTYRFRQAPLGPAQLEVGDVITVFTAEGRYVKAEVLHGSPAGLEIQWVAYPHGGTQPCWFSDIAPTSGVDVNGGAVVAQADSVTLCGTFHLDLDSGSSQDGSTDIWWEQWTDVRRDMNTSDAGRGLVNLGQVDFDALMLPDLTGLDYNAQKIVGNDDTNNELVDGDVFAVLTSEGMYAKVQILRYGYDLQVRFVTYGG